MRQARRGALARLVAGGVAGATAVAGFTVGLAAPAHAAPVAVTTTLTDPAGNALDGYVSYDLQQADGTYDYVGDTYVADGIVSLALEPGTYKLRFSDDDGLFVPEYYSDKATFDTADPVVVGGATALAPVSLAAAPALSGQVVAPDGKPIRDAYVGLYREGETFASRSFNTNAQGGFAFGVPVGNYKLVFSANGYSQEFFNNKPDLASADAIAVGAGGASAGQVVLTEGSVVTGRITGPGGVALERARVSVSTDTSSSYSDLTDANGVYRVEGVRAGTYKLEFTDPIGEYLSEWNADKATRATADPVAVGVEQVVSVDAELALDPTRRAIDPATVDAYGQVVDSAGQPVIGADVSVYDTPTDSDRPEIWRQVRTNRSGVYFFDDLNESTENAWKIKAADSLAREEGQFYRLDRWFGGAQTYEAATVVGVPTAGANISLPLTGGISGTVTSESSLPIDGVGVSFFNEKGNPVDPFQGGTGTEKDGTYLTTSLVPGTYKVQFVDYPDLFGYQVVSRHAPEWYDDATFAKAKTVTVTSGQTVANINAALSKDLKALRAPEVRGKQYLGGTLKAYSGVWSVESGTTYTYQWLRDGVVVGTGATYQVTKGDKNERIVLRTLAENDGLSGTALVNTQVIKKKPKVKVAVSGKVAKVLVKAKKKQLKKIKGTVVVKKLVREDEYGAPVYKKVGKGKLKNGKASLTLKKLKKGKNKLVFVITFKGGKLGNAEIAKTVKAKLG